MTAAGPPREQGRSRPPAELSTLRRRLLGWYRHHRRDLPWRQTRDPYAIWVSEIMLQQTTVAAAIPFYERWMERFPDVSALAAADEEEVLHLWSGLGYYNRARNLHAAAQVVDAQSEGCLPDTVEALMELPGIGRYTAGAIASIAFNRRVPIVDANVTRVVARLFAIRDQTDSADGQRKLWERAAQLAQTNNPGDLNQALMELGALVCTPTSPRCRDCPIRPVCKAAEKGEPERYPVLAPRPETEEVTEVGAVIERDGLFLLLRRPAQGRMAGMWEFPHGPVREEEPEEAVLPMIRGLTGLEATLAEHLVTVEHTFTHHRITLHVWRAHAGESRLHRKEHEDHRWLPLEKLADRPMATPQRRILEALFESAGGRQLDLLVGAPDESEETGEI